MTIEAAKVVYRKYEAPSIDTSSYLKYAAEQFAKNKKHYDAMFPASTKTTTSTDGFDRTDSTDAKEKSSKSKGVKIGEYKLDSATKDAIATEMDLIDDQLKELKKPEKGNKDIQEYRQELTDYNAQKRKLTNAKKAFGFFTTTHRGALTSETIRDLQESEATHKEAIKEYLDTNGDGTIDEAGDGEPATKLFGTLNNASLKLSKTINDIKPKKSNAATKPTEPTIMDKKGQTDLDILAEGLEKREEKIIKYTQAQKDEKIEKYESAFTDFMEEFKKDINSKENPPTYEALKEKLDALEDSGYYTSENGISLKGSDYELNNEAINKRLQLLMKKDYKRTNLQDIVETYKIPNSNFYNWGKLRKNNDSYNAMPNGHKKNKIAIALALDCEQVVKAACVGDNDRQFLIDWNNTIYNALKDMGYPVETYPKDMCTGDYEGDYRDHFNQVRNWINGHLLKQ